MGTGGALAPHALAAQMQHLGRGRLSDVMDFRSEVCLDSCAMVSPPADRYFARPTG